MKIFILLFVFIYIKGSRQSQRILEQVKKSGSLKVKGLSNTEEYQNEQKYCFPIQIQHKNKRKGYEKIKKKYNTIKNKLINKQIINDGSSFQLIKQEVRMNNNQKSKIKRSVCIITDQQYEVYLKKLLKKHQINKVSSGFSHDITQQDLLMKAFNDANRKAKQLLDKIDYKISKIQSITILNDNVRIQYPQTDLSSFQYDPQVSSLSEQMKRSVSAQQQNDSGDNSIVQDVEVEIVFAVKKSSNQQNDQSSSEQEAHSEVNNRKNNDQSSQQL